MTTERIYIDYLADILDTFEKIEQFIQGMTFETFVQDHKTTRLFQTDPQHPSLYFKAVHATKSIYSV